MVPEGGVLHGVLGGQGDAAEQDEEEDQVGENGVIDDTMALEAEPAGAGGGGLSHGVGSLLLLGVQTVCRRAGRGPFSPSHPAAGETQPCTQPHRAPRHGASGLRLTLQEPLHLHVLL